MYCAYLSPLNKHLAYHNKKSWDFPLPPIATTIQFDHYLVYYHRAQITSEIVY
jgi:hypothetical protein